MQERLRSNLIVLALIALIFALYGIRKILLLIFLAVIFAIILNPLVEAIRRIHIYKWTPGEGAAIVILLAIFLAVLSLFLMFALPPIIHDSRGFAQDLPERMGQLRDRVRSLPFGSHIADKINAADLQKYAGELIQSVFSIFKGVASSLTALLTLALMTAYFILDGNRSFRWMLSLVPGEQRPRLQNVLERAAHRAQRWLGGQALLMLILGGSSAIAFTVLGIRYSYALAVFAGLANFVPILGPIVTVIVAGIVAALDSFAKLLGVVIFYLIYQQVENAYLTPRIMRSSVQLPAITVIVALAIGGAVAGVLGAMVAVPTAAIASTVINEYLVHKDDKARLEQFQGRE